LFYDLTAKMSAEENGMKCVPEESETSMESQRQWMRKLWIPLLTCNLFLCVWSHPNHSSICRTQNFSRLEPE